MEINPKLLARVYAVYEFFMNQSNAVFLRTGMQRNKPEPSLTDADFTGIEDFEKFFAALMQEEEDDDASGDSAEGDGGTIRGLRGSGFEHLQAAGVAVSES